MTGTTVQSQDCINNNDNGGKYYENRSIYRNRY